MPRPTTRIAGRIEPAIVPSEPSSDDARTPRRFSSVVSQKKTSMTVTR